MGIDSNFSGNLELIKAAATIVLSVISYNFAILMMHLPDPTPAVKQSIHRVSAQLGITLLGTLALGVVVGPTSADRLHLVGGGHVDGMVINRDRSANEPYIVRTDFGKITVKSSDVQNAKLLRKEQQLYERYARRTKTASDHWKMAEWCKKHNLLNERRHHLLEVVRLDPDHAQARSALNFRLIDGKWQSRTEFMEKRGYVRYKSQWRLAQDVAILEAKEKEQSALREYRNQLKRWRSWLGKRREAEAVDAIRQIHDPLAVPAIKEQLENETNAKVVDLYVAALGRIATPSATRSLVDLALNTDDEELRIRCVQKLKTPDQVELASNVMIEALSSPSNALIHRAAKCLANFESPNALPPLIDALVTTHTMKVGAGQEGRIAPTFSRGPGGTSGGLAMGGKAKIKKVTVKNRPVLEAILSLTENVNFEYDQERWRRWYESQHIPVNVNLRRDA